MENKNLGDTGKYTFVSEKRLPKRKKKLKKLLIYLGCTVVCAVLFGLIARIVFIKSDSFLCKLFGIEAEQTNEPDRDRVNISTAPSDNPGNEGQAKPTEMADCGKVTLAPSPDGNKQEENNPENVGEGEKNPQGGETGGTSQGNNSEENQENVPENNPGPDGSPDVQDENKDETGKPSDTNSQESEGEKITPSPTPVIIEQRMEASIDDYITIMTEMRRLASEVTNSLVNVITYTSGVNWMNEKIESVEEITGVVMGDDNVSLLILASYDKVKDVDRINVRFSTISTCEAELYSFDSEYNLAVLAVALSDIPESIKETCKPAVFGESMVIYTGMPIMALGSPNGYIGSLEYGFVTSKGSTKYVTDNEMELFNTDITDNENSDGIIVNMRGQLIGIITHTLKDDKNLNISTAMGVTKLKSIILKLINNDERSYFGIKAENLPASVLSERGLENGIYITEVISGSPAARVGLRKGDIITNIDGSRIMSVSDFGGLISSRSVGEWVDIVYWRRSGTTVIEMNTEVELEAKPSNGR